MDGCVHSAVGEINARVRRKGFHPDCPKPPEKEHIVLTNESLLKNAFPKDTEVTFVCTNGYEKHNGSESITCTGTEWTEPDLMCKKKDCGYPQKLPNMILIVNDGTLLGASVKVTCEEGYRVIGSSFKRCFANGWIGRSRCDLIVCDVPSEVISGQHTWTSAEKPRHGDVIQYSCDAGFTLNGTSHVICQGRGVYNTTPPTCEAVVCDLPSEINDGRHLWTSADRPRYEDEIHYSCNTGFTLHGSSHLICRSPGVYNAAPPTCKEDESTTPTLNITSTPHASIQGGIYTVAATEDNLMNTEASSRSSPSLAAVTVPATPGTHGANTIMTTHKHAISTKSRTPVASTPESLVRGGIYTVAATEDNLMNTEASGRSSPSLVAVTVPATPGTHGANTIMTTHKHAISTKPRNPVASTPESLVRGNLKELDNIKDPDSDTKDAVSLRRKIVAASVLSTLLVVLLVVLLIFYVYRYRWRRGNAITSNEEYNVCYHGGSEGQCGPAFPSKEPYPAHPQTQ
ncbi:complement decay-accelerating factor isoform X3 [Gadus chalcogrammus]|uniref:complement decay-accelerating factor isoform X3 n=1 Tax=Gadus chalcogrammus TaxID=1042646 RepID=UPI0024C49E49|nr:complement decay-accelerating factor isoform X3 [Gadus chalcogrammus]